MALLGKLAEVRAELDAHMIMRTLHFIPIKSRRLMPGGFRDTVTRGWARPVRGSSALTVSGVNPNIKVRR